MAAVRYELAPPSAATVAATVAATATATATATAITVPATATATATAPASTPAAAPHGRRGAAASVACRPVAAWHRVLRTPLCSSRRGIVRAFYTIAAVLVVAMVVVLVAFHGAHTRDDSTLAAVLATDVVSGAAAASLAGACFAGAAVVSLAAHAALSDNADVRAVARMATVLSALVAVQFGLRIGEADARTTPVVQVASDLLAVAMWYMIVAVAARGTLAWLGGQLLVSGAVMVALYTLSGWHNPVPGLRTELVSASGARLALMYVFFVASAALRWGALNACQVAVAKSAPERWGFRAVIAVYVSTLLAVLALPAAHAAAGVGGMSLMNMMLTVAQFSLVPLLIVHLMTMSRVHTQQLAQRVERAEKDRELALAHATGRQSFLRYILHEVRVPFTALLLGLDTLAAAKELGAFPALADDVAAMRASADSMSTILNDTLDMEKINSGAYSLEFRPVNPRDVVARVARNMQPWAARAHVALRCDIDAAVPPLVRADGNRLAQVAANFVSNAIKFSPHDGTGAIVVRLRIAPPPAAAATAAAGSAHTRSSSVAGVLPPDAAAAVAVDITATTASAAGAMLTTPPAAPAAASVAVATIAATSEALPPLSSSPPQPPPLPAQPAATATAAAAAAATSTDSDAAAAPHAVAWLDGALLAAPALLRAAAASAARAWCCCYCRSTRRTAPWRPLPLLITSHDSDVPADSWQVPATPATMEPLPRAGPPPSPWARAAGASASLAEEGGARRRSFAAARSGSSLRMMWGQRLPSPLAAGGSTASTPPSTAAVGTADSAQRRSPHGGSALHPPPPASATTGAGTMVTLRIEVEDNGCGISIANQARLFGEFQQIQAGALQGGKGSGLGLFICKTIATRHGGAVGVTSAVGRGSTFYIDVPAQVLPPAPAWATSDGRVPSAYDVGGGAGGGGGGDGGLSMLPPPPPPAWVVAGSPSAGSAASATPAAAGGGTPHAHGGAGDTMDGSDVRALHAVAVPPPLPGAVVPPPAAASLAGASSGMAGTNRSGTPRHVRVLLVDDDATTRLFLARGLRARLGERAVVEACDGADVVAALAAAAAAGQPITAIAMDKEMPRLDGVAATRAARAAGFSGTVVAVTGGGDSAADVRAFIAAGADAVLCKPVRPAELATALLYAARHAAAAATAAAVS